MICNKQKSKSGQALVETVMFLPLLTIVIVLIVWTSRILITKQQLVMAARYGTDMIAYTSMSKAQINKEIENYLCHHRIEGRKLDPSRLRSGIHISYDGKRFPRISISDPEGMIDMLLNIDDILDTSWVELYYRFNTPKIFTAFKGYIPGGESIPEYLEVSGRSEVLAGTGAEKPSE